LEFVELPENRRRWPLATHLDGAQPLALALRCHLYNRRVSRNGHPNAEPRPMSTSQICNVMGTTAALFNFARDPSNNLLPATFVNPISRDLVGQRPRRDPLAPAKFPPEARLQLVHGMDLWQVITLSWFLVLPPRPEEIAGILIEDMLRERREIVFRTRCGGDDFNKARVNFRVTYPPQFDPIVEYLAAGRSCGPLLRRRPSSRRRRSRGLPEGSDLLTEYRRLLSTASRNDVQQENDRKRYFRRALRAVGGIDEEELAKEFQGVKNRMLPNVTGRFYDLRGSITTDLRISGVADLLRKYVTGRSLRRDVMSFYEAQDLHNDMNKYFSFISPLLDVIAERFDALKKSE
jgi:hypothetical protein